VARNSRSWHPIKGWAALWPAFPTPKALCVASHWVVGCLMPPGAMGSRPVALLRPDEKTHAEAIPCFMPFRALISAMAGLVVEQLLPDPARTESDPIARKGENSRRTPCPPVRCGLACKSRKAGGVEHVSAAAGRGPWLSIAAEGKALRGSHALGSGAGIGFAAAAARRWGPSLHPARGL